jgi:dihydropteroate synthase
MLTLADLARLADGSPAALGLPVGPLWLGDHVIDVNTRPVVMGTINLSRDSTYRDSIATSAADAIRRGRVMTAQGADIVDIGAESTTARAARIDPTDQSASVVPVIEALAADGICVSIEAYSAEVVKQALAAGAQVVNLTGAAEQDVIFELAASFDATVVVCYVGGQTVRDVTDVPLDADPIPELLDHFNRRIERARALGAERLVIDPGMGFFYGNLTDPAIRVQHQTQVLLNTFRLRQLGLPICHALPHAFDLFGDQFRSAEAYFATLAFLGGTSIFRTHEVPSVRAVLDAMVTLTVSST